MVFHNLEPVRIILNALIMNRHHPNLNHNIRQLYNRAKNLEYGAQARLVEEGTCSIIGLLCAASRLFEIKFNVFCGTTPLKAIHDGKYLINFDYSESAEALVFNIGLVGCTIFHRMEQFTINDPRWLRISERGLRFLLPEHVAMVWNIPADRQYPFTLQPARLTLV